VKIKSLAEEARIIRQEEQRQKADPIMRESLRFHRVHDLRREQRASLLAYTLIRGRSYASAECAKTPPPTRRIIQLVETFGYPHPFRRPPKQEIADRVHNWLRADPCGREPGVMTPVHKGVRLPSRAPLRHGSSA